MLKQEYIPVALVFFVMLAYFLISTPVMMDDGEQYEGFAESLARGVIDFKSFYGFQGLSILSVPVFWITHSKISIIITSAILYLLALPLAYLIGRDYFKGSGTFSATESSEKVPDPFNSGLYFMVLVMLMPYTYTTMMRGFQEAALLFFILLIIYGAINKRVWTPIAWAIGGIVKPFALVLFPLFVEIRGQVPFLYLQKRYLTPLIVGLSFGFLYLVVSYSQTGHLVNNAAINSYQGNFDTGNPPPLVESFTVGTKGFLRVGANLFLHFRKIMISPLVIILGAFALWYNKQLKLRKEIMLAIALNLLLVGSLTFSFSKYLLPTVVLLALSSVDYLSKYKWLIWLVIVDSFFVFLPIWDYFGYNFWANVWVYLTPLWLATAILIVENRKHYQS